MEQEKWVDIEIPGLDQKYQVSTMGQIKRLAYDVVSQRNGTEYIMHKNETILKLQNQKYQMVMLMVNGKQKSFYVHRLVAQAFIPNPDNLPEVNHKDENKLNNFVFINPDGSVNPEKSNLEWCTHNYNMNYGTRMDRVRQTMIESGNWQDYSGFSNEEKKGIWNKQRKEWKEKNKEYIKECHREYWKKNKEYLAERQKEWRKNNKEKCKAMRRKAYENKREYLLKYQKEYQKMHYQKKLDHTVYVYKLVTKYELVGVYDKYSTAANFIGVSSSTIKKRIDNNSLKQVNNYVVSKEKLN